MIYQTDPSLGKWINKYGCLFTSIAYAREYLRGHKWTAKEIYDAWMKCIEIDAISGDLNADNDMDDPGEAIINDHQKVCDVLWTDLTYIPGHHNINTPITASLYAIGEFYNPRTRFTHFAVVDKDKKVLFDPIKGGSITCREGYLKSLRLYSIL